jgi:predicted nuclease with TOPRIM domain
MFAATLQDAADVVLGNWQTDEAAFPGGGAAVAMARLTRLACLHSRSHVLLAQMIDNSTHAVLERTTSNGELLSAAVALLESANVDQQAFEEQVNRIVAAVDRLTENETRRQDAVDALTTRLDEFTERLGEIDARLEAVDLDRYLIDDDGRGVGVEPL